MNGLKFAFRWAMAAMLALSIGAICSADEAPAPPKTGTLTAKGKGMAMLKLEQGAVVLSSFKGDLWVSENATVSIDGKSAEKVKKSMSELMAGKGPGKPSTNSNNTDSKKPADTAGYLYKNVDGTATITGTNVDIHVQMTAGEIRAAGIGAAMMMGDGTYITTKEGVEGKTDGKWTAMSKMPSGGEGGMGRPGGPPPGGEGGMGGPGGPPPGGESGSKPESRQMKCVKFGDAKDMQMPGMPGRK
ncbi:MAG: hypothetical protein ABFD49_00230 [Armatimonadota bacterium]|nr:hypothetical protein [bacterium]